NRNRQKSDHKINNGQFRIANARLPTHKTRILSGAMNVLILQCCVFFFCLCTRESIEIMFQFQTLGIVSDSKMNLVGALRRSFFEFPNSFQKRREKQKIN
ncbi:Uncharacterized protein FWK35_00003676, partial [Aphis craccivora]